MIGGIQDLHAAFICHDHFANESVGFFHQHDLDVGPSLFTGDPGAQRCNVWNLATAARRSDHFIQQGRIYLRHQGGFVDDYFLSVLGLNRVRIDGNLNGAVGIFIHGICEIEGTVEISRRGVCPGAITIIDKLIPFTIVDIQADLGTTDTDGGDGSVQGHGVRIGFGDLATDKCKDAFNSGNGDRTFLGGRIVDHLVQDHVSVFGHREGRFIG